MHPFLVRHVLLPLHERLKGAATFAWLRRLERTQWLSRDELLDLQMARLREHVRFAYEHTVYYRQLLDEHGLPPTRIRTLDDFSRIPVLTRELLRTHFEDLRARGVRLGRVQRLSTGGSTGVPVSVLMDTSVGIDVAVRHRAHRWFGAEPGAREVVLWGSPIELGRQDRFRSLRDWLLNSRLVSAFDLGEKALAGHARVLERYQPEVLYGYASAFYVLARYLRRVGWRPSWRLKAIFATAEPLLDFQRQVIREVFGCPVAVEYGARDAGHLADECPDGGLHIPAECTYLEANGSAQDGLGEIVVTNLYSRAMPLIRYATGDMGELSDGECRCGRSLPLLKRVDGRRTDFLITPGGRVLHALGVIYVLREVPGVEEFQVVQETVGRIRVDVVADSRFALPEEAAIRRGIGKLMGPDVDVEVHRVDQIKRAPSGKYRYVVSKVADAHLDGHPVGPALTARHAGPAQVE